MACTMGWVQSPPTFCAMSETIADLANAHCKRDRQGPPAHRLEALAGANDKTSRDFLPEPREPEDALANDRLAKLYPGIEEDRPLEVERAPLSNDLGARPVGCRRVHG